jgi:hypothetical protein
MESIVKARWNDPIDYLLSANDNPFEDKYLNITYQYNKARALALDGGYDALMCVESDMIIPHDALERLAACESDVAYGLYIFRHTRHAWSAYTNLEGQRGESLSADPDRARALWGQVLDVAGVGLGCTLIRRNALERVKFRLFEDNPSQTACDWLFAQDVASEGLSQRCDLGVVCGHQSYTPYPMTLWPDITQTSLYRRESFEGVKLEPIKPGQQFKVGMGETMLVPNG